MKRAPRRRRTAAEARRAILEAAEKRLVVGGPEAIRLQGIAADVGISHPAILHHFGSRAHLLEALVEHGLQGLQAEFLAGWPSQNVPDIEGGIERFHRMAAKRGYARLLAWLVLSGRGLRALKPGSLRPLVERMHVGLGRVAAREGGSAPDFEATRFIATLFAVTMFGEALFGPVTRRSLGLRADTATARCFRVGLAQVFEAMRHHGGHEDGKT